MWKNKRWYNEETNSCRQVFSISNPQRKICNRFTHEIYTKTNLTTLAICMFFTLFIQVFPYRAQGFPLKFDDTPYNNVTENNDKYIDFDVLTTETSPITTNIYEDDMMSSTIYEESYISYNNNNNKNESLFDSNNNNIIIPNERNTEINNVEDLEQSIRSSVKFEIEADQRLESSQAMKIFKDLTDPDLKKILSADTISLEDFNQNEMNYSLTTEQSALLNNEIKGSMELLGLPKSEENLMPEDTSNTQSPTDVKSLVYPKDINKNEEILPQTGAFLSTGSVKESLTNMSTFLANEHVVNNIENVLDKTESKEKPVVDSNIKVNYDKLNNDKSPNKSQSADQFMSSNISSLFRLEASKTLASLRNLANTDSWKSGSDSIKTENTISDDIKEDSNTNNELLSVTLHEAISEIPTYSNENDVSDIEEYNSSTEPLVKKYHTIDIENVKHVIIKKVLNAQEKSNIVSETTPRVKLISLDEIISSCLKLEQILKNYTSNNMNINNQSATAEKLSNQENIIEGKLINESTVGNSKNYINGTNIEMITTAYFKPNTKNNTETYLNTMSNPKSEFNTLNEEDTKEYNPHIESSLKLKDLFNSSLQHVHKPAENITSEDIMSSNITIVSNELKGSSSVNEKNSSTKPEDVVTALFEGYPPQDVEQTFNDNLADELTDIRKPLADSFIDGPSRSTMIIILCSGTAFLFILISITIFLISFQRQNGTLNIEMQERSCGKDNLDEEDAQTFAMLLDVEFSQFAAVDDTDECL